MHLTLVSSLNIERLVENIVGTITTTNYFLN